MTSKRDQLEPLQFQFNVDEVQDNDNHTTIEIGIPPANTDVQAQRQQSLTPEQLEQLFQRTSSELVRELPDEQDFVQREASIKAPKTSKTIETPFPPAAVDRPEDLVLDIEQLHNRAKQDAGPLIIERYSPSENQVDHPLCTVTLTYNQPMFAVSSLDEQIRAEDLGISLIPRIEGRWTWAGTKTIQFEAQHRLPFATKYTVTVDKERCVSAIGGKTVGNGTATQSAFSLH